MASRENHLNLVFKHEIDPASGGNQEELQQTHDGAATKTRWRIVTEEAAISLLNK